MGAMSLTVATWNINSVRLRIANVTRFLRLRKPDVLCLQETKCPDEFFPHKPFEKLGYTHRLVQGMKSYNGVAILSKVPFTAMNVHHRCGKEDCRHIEVALDVGDLNVAPLEHDVWSHKQMLKVISHTPTECEKLTAVQKIGNWVDTMRVHTPEPEKLYTWWSYRAMENWRISDRGRRLDHIWTSNAIADRVSRIKVYKDYRGYERPSDHVPVTATFELN